MFRILIGLFLPATAWAAPASFTAELSLARTEALVSAVDFGRIQERFGLLGVRLADVLAYAPPAGVGNWKALTLEAKIPYLRLERMTPRAQARALWTALRRTGDKPPFRTETPLGELEWSATGTGIRLRRDTVDREALVALAGAFGGSLPPYRLEVSVPGEETAKLASLYGGWLALRDDGRLADPPARSREGDRMEVRLSGEDAGKEWDELAALIEKPRPEALTFLANAIQEILADDGGAARFWEEEPVRLLALLEESEPHASPDEVAMPMEGEEMREALVTRFRNAETPDAIRVELLRFAAERRDRNDGARAFALRLAQEAQKRCRPWKILQMGEGTDVMAVLELIALSTEILPPESRQITLAHSALPAALEYQMALPDEIHAPALARLVPDNPRARQRALAWLKDPARAPYMALALVGRPLDEELSRALAAVETPPAEPSAREPDPAPARVPATEAAEPADPRGVACEILNRSLLPEIP